MKINNNQPSFKRVHIDLAHIEDTVGKTIAKQLEVAMPKIKEMATKKDVFVRGVQYPKDWYTMQNGIEVSVKTKQQQGILSIFKTNKISQQIIYNEKSTFIPNVIKALATLMEKA